MPATQPDRSSQHAIVRDDGVASNPNNKDNSCQLDDNLQLTINFLGCPSRSASISYSVSDTAIGSTMCKYGGTEKHRKPGLLQKTGVINSDTRFCQTSQEQNNNQCSNTNITGDNDVYYNETTGALMDTNNDATTTHSDEDDDNSGDDEDDDNICCNTPIPRGEASDGNCVKRSVTPGREMTSNASGCATDAGLSLQALCKKNSTGSLDSVGRMVGVQPRGHRSPQRNNSLKMAGGRGSSAPVGFLPSSHHNSSVLTKTNRQPGVARKDGTQMNSSRMESYETNSIIHEYNNQSDGEEDESKVKRQTRSSRASSPSKTSSSKPPKCVDPPPTQSAGVPDLRKHPSSAPITRPIVKSLEIQKIPCQLILPEESVWSPRAPHGDIKHQAKPQHDNEKKHKTIHHEECKKSTYASAETLLYDSEKARSSGASLVMGRDNILDGASSHTNTSSSTGTLIASGASSATNKPRSSRRHPVLDKMFRHVLFSLVQDSGPPNSSHLASVLGHTSEKEGSSYTSANNQTSQQVSESSASVTIGSVSSRSSMDRLLLFGHGAGGRGSRAHNKPGLPCTLSKVDENRPLSSSRPSVHEEMTAMPELA